MEETVTQIATQIFIAYLKIWPEATIESLVADSVKAAKLIAQQTDVQSYKAQLHNLQLDHNSLRKKYSDLSDKYYQVVLAQSLVQEELRDK